MRVVCAKCGVHLWDQPETGGRERVCERCGGQPPIVEITAEDSAVGLEARAKIDERLDPSRAPVRSTTSKNEITRDTGRRSDRKYVVDRTSGSYEETVKDQETGEVIFEKHQSLKDKNRGAAPNNGGDAA